MIQNLLYVPVVTLSSQDNIKIQQQLKSGFKCIINCNNYQSKVLMRAQANTDITKPILAYPNFQGVRRIFFYHLHIVWSYRTCRIYRIFTSKSRNKRLS